jgi:hypothetical protein
MFKILELDNTPSSTPTEVGDGFAMREDALAAVKRHLKGAWVIGPSRRRPLSE